MTQSQNDFDFRSLMIIFTTINRKIEGSNPIMGNAFFIL